MFDRSISRAHTLARILGVLAIVFASFVAFSATTNLAAAAELTGYAWSENTGWISLSCENDDSCGSVDYGVTVNNDGTLSGYAWSAGKPDGMPDSEPSGIGWVKFGAGQSDDGTFPDASVVDESAKLAVSNGSLHLEGWARACAATQNGDCATPVHSDAGSWDGWISLSCTTTGSCGTTSYYSYLSDTPPAEPVAWGSNVIGWVLMSGIEANVNNDVTADIYHRRVGATEWNYDSAPTYPHSQDIEIGWESTGAENCVLFGPGFDESNETEGVDDTIDEQDATYAVACIGSDDGAGGFDGIGFASFDLTINPDDVYGCTDPGAANFDPLASIDSIEEGEACVYSDLPECSDGIDNDGDGYGDHDGIDEDGVDLPPDPDCTGPDDPSESDPTESTGITIRACGDGSCSNPASFSDSTDVSIEWIANGFDDCSATDGTDAGFSTGGATADTDFLGTLGTGDYTFAIACNPTGGGAPKSGSVDVEITDTAAGGAGDVYFEEDATIVINEGDTVDLSHTEPQTGSSYGEDQCSIEQKPLGSIDPYVSLTNDIDGEISPTNDITIRISCGGGADVSINTVDIRVRDSFQEI